MMVKSTDEKFIKRCIDLAWLGAGKVSPNPMVGAVLVHNQTIIGEGYHQYYGGPHAEVNAVASVTTNQRHLIAESTLYVSLEPCNFFGKTPACTKLIIKNKIPRVVISVLDNTDQVDGKGIAELEAAGVEVKTGVLPTQGMLLNRFRDTLNEEGRPYVMIKFAQTKDHFFAPEPPSQFWISNEYSKRLSHRWRSEIDAILVGTKTAMIDNPSLTNRLYFGGSPIRIMIDQHGKLSPKLKVFNNQATTLLVLGHDAVIQSFPNHVHLLTIDFSGNFIQELLIILKEKFKIGIILIEGGAFTIQQFIDQGLWDEIRVFTGNKSLPKKGIPSPRFPSLLSKHFKIHQDGLTVFFRNVKLQLK